MRPLNFRGEGVRAQEARRDSSSTYAHARELRQRNARMIQVRHRSYATYSRQPRQVRKEATVTGSCVCSGFPVPGLIFVSTESRFHLRRTPSDALYTLFTTLCARSATSRPLYESVVGG